MKPRRREGIKEWTGRLFAWAGLGYVLTVVAIIFLWNRRLGYPFPMIADDSQGKWRGESREFENFALLWGGLAFVPIVYGFVFFVRRFAVNYSLWERFVSVAAIALFALPFSLLLYYRVTPMLPLLMLVMLATWAAPLLLGVLLFYIVISYAKKAR